MQYRTGVVRSLRLLTASPSLLRPAAAPRAWSSTTTTTPTRTGTADPAIHSEDPQDEEAEEAVKSAQAQQLQDERILQRAGERETQPLQSATDIHKTPFSSSGKLESSELGERPDPTFQQKRRLGAVAPKRGVVNLDDVSCVGWSGGSPLVGDRVGEDTGVDDGRSSAGKDNDTHRFEASRALPPEAGDVVSSSTTGNAGIDEGGGMGPSWSYYGGGWEAGGGEGVEEDEDEAVDGVDESLSRAEALFREAALRGDPESPQAEALRRLDRAGN